MPCTSNAPARQVLRLTSALCSGGPLPHLSPADVQMVRRHRLAPLAYQAGADQFHDDYVAATLQADIRDRVLTEALDVLNHAGIRPALIKGIAYGDLYEHGQRPMTDIDLLVRAGHHSRAVAALERLGYRDAGSRASRARTHHAVTLKRPGAAIDLHRAMIQPWRARVRMGEIWSRARPHLHIHGADRLDDLDRTLFHFIHLARHELRVPLINYVDSHRLLAHLGPDALGPLCDRAREYRVARGVTTAIAASRRLATGERGAVSRFGPTAIELARMDMPARPRQVLEKLALADSPGRALGVLAVGIWEQGVVPRLARRS